MSSTTFPKITARDLADLQPGDSIEHAFEFESYNEYETYTVTSVEGPSLGGLALVFTIDKDGDHVQHAIQAGTDLHHLTSVEARKTIARQTKATVDAAFSASHLRNDYLVALRTNKCPSCGGRRLRKTLQARKPCTRCDFVAGGPKVTA